MANNCSNTLYIKGSIEDIKRLEECMSYKNEYGHDDWTLRNIIPVETDENGYYKVDDIYAVWGTKWFDGEYFKNNGDSAILSFDTAWSPSLPVTLEMSKRFNLEIEHYYEESGCDFEGDYHVDNGEVVFEEQRAYKPQCRDCEEKFDADSMTYDEDEGEYTCRMCGDELARLVRDKMELNKSKEENK